MLAQLALLGGLLFSERKWRISGPGGEEVLGENWEEWIEESLWLGNIVLEKNKFKKLIKKEYSYTIRTPI